jgi:hypothetical protein
MQQGSKVIAPEGFGALERGINYFFLRSNAATKTVQLVLFARTHRWVAHLISLPRDQFEYGVTSRLIQEVKEDARPPFLEGLGTKNPQAMDLDRPNAKQRHFERVEARFFGISPLIKRQHDILCAAKPEYEMNLFARKNGLNEQRVRFWFLAYLCFGRDSWILAPHYFNCGRWDRVIRTEGPKWGRPSIARGKYAGHRLSAGDIDLIHRAYKAVREEGRKMTEIYQIAMVKYFKAESIKDPETGQKRLLSRDGRPVPTEDQFRYQVKKAFGEEVTQFRWGAAKYRRTQAPHKGAFASAVSNLLEKTEADAYYCEDRPRSYIGDAHLAPLIVTRIIDVASGMRIGIGFSHGAETSEAYNAALFCAAIPKKDFCRLFGVEIEDSDWPSIGLSPHLITDRGPGIATELNRSPTGSAVPLRELTPSGKGQSKALVESSQRRTPQLDGPTRYTLSELTLNQLMAREIRRLLGENQSANVSERMVPEMWSHQILPTPLNVWTYLDERARNDGTLITFDAAVREFLTEVDVTLDRAGVRFYQRLYRSQTLTDCGVMNSVGRVGTKKLRAYVLPMCCRFIWVDVGGQLIEVEGVLNLREDPEMLNSSLAEIVQEDKVSKMLNAEHRIHKNAVVVEQLKTFEQEQGGKWHSGIKTTRPPKRTSSVRQEEQLIQAALGGKKEKSHA